MGIFYVYIYFRLDGTPLYIGKGYGTRWLKLKGRNLHFSNIIAAAKREGRELPRFKIREGLTDKEAVQIERAFIAAIGRKPHGPLVNLTDGGEGTSDPSEETRAKLRRRSRKLWDDPAHQQFMSESTSARYESQEERDKTGESTKRGLHKPETRKRHLEWLTEENWNRPGARQERSALWVKRYEDPTERAKLTEMANTRWAKEGAQERMKAIAKALWADPAYRAKVTAANKATAARMKRDSNGHFSGA